MVLYIEYNVVAIIAIIASIAPMCELYGDLTIISPTIISTTTSSSGIVVGESIVRCLYTYSVGPLNLQDASAQDGRIWVFRDVFFQDEGFQTTLFKPHILKHRIPEPRVSTQRRPHVFLTLGVPIQIIRYAIL